MPKIKVNKLVRALRRNPPQRGSGKRNVRPPAGACHSHHGKPRSQGWARDQRPHTGAHAASSARRTDGIGPDCWNRLFEGGGHIDRLDARRVTVPPTMRAFSCPASAAAACAGESCSLTLYAAGRPDETGNGMGLCRRSGATASAEVEARPALAIARCLRIEVERQSVRW